MRVLIAMMLWCGPAYAGDEEEAVAAVTAAVELYQKGEFAQAAEQFLRAFELSQRPVQLRNAARAYEEGGREQEARELWARYSVQPGLTGAERDEAAAHVRLIDSRREARESRERIEEANRLLQIADREAAKRSAEMVRLQRSIEKDDRELSTVAIITGAGGAAMAIASATLLALSVTHARSLEAKLAMKDASGLITGIDHQQARESAARISDERHASLGLAIGAGAALLSALIIYLVDAS